MFQQKQTDFSCRERIAHALLVYPFASAIGSHGAVEAVTEAMNEWVPAGQRFAAHWTPLDDHVEDGYGEAGDGEWMVGQLVAGPGNYQSLRELEHRALTAPEERSALAVANLIMFGLSYWKFAGLSKVFRRWLRAEALTSTGELDFEDLIKFSRLVSYAWNEDFECKRLIGLSLLATSGSPARQASRIDDINLLTYTWKRLFAMYSHEPEVWAPVRVEPTKKKYNGLVFWVDKQPVDAVLTGLLEGRLRGVVPLQVGRELLRWMCLPEGAA